MAYQPIDNYGLIGDLHTVALVGVDGSIDWLCMPRFDSPSVFAAILDDEKGGRFRIAPADEDDVSYKQFYWPATNVLVTRFLSDQGAAELTDFMPIGETGGGTEERRDLIRRLSVTRGTIAFRMECRPAFNFARDPHETILVDGGAEFHAKAQHLGLATRTPLAADGTGVVAEFSLSEGDSAVFVLRERSRGSGRRHPSVRGRGRGRLSRDRRVLAPLAGAVHLFRPLARDRAALGAGAQASDLRADRGDRRRPDLQPARGHRRRAQLGLPLYLDPRFGVHDLRLPAPRLHQGSRSATSRSWRASAHKSKDGSLQIMYGIDGREQLERGDSRPPRRLPRLAAGAHRQRRVQAAPARHLRRAARCLLSVQQVRPAHGLRCLDHDHAGS